jgi:hypothetical protein
MAALRSATQGCRGQRAGEGRETRRDSIGRGASNRPRWKLRNRGLTGMGWMDGNRALLPDMKIHEPQGKHWKWSGQKSTEALPTHAPSQTMEPARTDHRADKTYESTTRRQKEKKSKENGKRNRRAALTTVGAVCTHPQCFSNDFSRPSSD